MGRAVIIGGGISGLSTAYYLSRQGMPSTLVERQPRLGGVIATERVDGCLVEAGPDSFLSAKPWALDLIRDLGLADEVIGSNDHLRVTYIQKRGRLVPMPDGLMLMVPTRILPMIATSLLGWPTKIRMGLEWFRRPPHQPLPDRSVAEMIRDHYGTEAVDYLAEPLLAGVYGGDPARLSAPSVLPRFAEMEQKYGSLTRGVLAERKPSGGAPLFRTLRDGLGQLTGAIEAAIRPHCQRVQGTAEAVSREGSGYRVRVNGGWMEADHLVLACQAYEAGMLVSGLDGQLAELLGLIPYNSSTTVALGFERSEIHKPLAGFGFLVPRRERRRVAACTWVGTKFAHRVPDSRVLLRCFLGGVEAESDEALYEAVLEDLRRILDLRAQPVFRRLYRWPRSMAQYTVGHARRIEQIEGRLAGWPGLQLAGNGYHGIGIPDCVRMGKQAAERILSAP